jgi:TPR repeat protein
MSTRPRCVAPAQALLHHLSTLTLLCALGGALCLSLPARSADQASPAPHALPATSPSAGLSTAEAEAIAQFNRAAAGQDAAVEPALAFWRARSAADPVNPVPRAFTGALTSMQARSTLLPWRKMSHVDDGLALLDKALAQLTPAHEVQRFNGVPASLQVRFVAASTFCSLPAMFNRGDRGAKLLDDVLKSPLFDSTPAGFKAAVWLRAGDNAVQAGNKDSARQWLSKAADSGTPQAADAQARLKAL